MWSPHQNNKGRKIKMKVKDILKAQKQYERLQEEVEHIKKFKEDLSLMRPKDSFNDDGFYGLICDIEEKMIPAFLDKLKKQLNEMEV